MTEEKRLKKNKPPDYMKYVTNNVRDMVPNTKNLVACVHCLKIYETKRLPQVHGCLLCKCGVDAVMVVARSPLHGLSEPEQQVLLKKWNVEGFTPIPRSK